MASDEAFLQHLRATFRVEAEELLQVLATGLLELEAAGIDPAAQAALVERLFRAAHSLKGAARSVDLARIEGVCHAIEDTLARWKRRDEAPNRARLDALHAQLDEIGRLLASAFPAPAATPFAHVEAVAPAAAGQPQPQARARPAERPRAALPAATAAAPASRPVAEETVRVDLRALDRQLLRAEEILSVKLIAQDRALSLRQLLQQVQHWRDQCAPAGRAAWEAAERAVAVLAHDAERDRAHMGKLVDDLLAESKQLLLLPFATIVPALQKVVRDLCREQRKEAEFVVEGEQVAVDKRILDALKDALIHLLRNCIDHGIEPPDLRARVGKPQRARIHLAVAQSGGSRIAISLTDDGAGIDPERVRAAAVRQGLVTAQEAADLGEDASLDLVFRSGLSTRAQVTGVSGRGLGLAIVRQQAQALGGEVSVATAPGGGAAFRILVPALRATFRGVLVEVAGAAYVFPASQVQCVSRAAPAEIRAADSGDTWRLQGRPLPIVRLADVLGLRAAAPALDAAGLPVVVVGPPDEALAVTVDRVGQEQEFLVKPLAPPLARVRNIAAATVLVDGRVALVVHVGDLLRSARRVRGGVLPVPATEAAGRSILVAEDSITSRTLLKQVLEDAGYRVTTAADGLDALHRLRQGGFDLVVSDVEMPRLNGFDLTARIRADQALAATPVILVTALESQEHRTRGVEVGADAYIVKSDFEQGTLLETVARLT